MIKLFLAVLLLFLQQIHYSIVYKPKPMVSATLTLEFIELKEETMYPAGLAIRVKIQNNTKQKIFIGNILPGSPEIWKEDLLQNRFKSFNVERFVVRQIQVIPTSIRAQIGDTLPLWPQSSIQDSLVRLHMKGIMNGKAPLKKVTKEQYERIYEEVKDCYNFILYLEPGQTHEELFNITSFLNRNGKQKGKYKVVFNSPNVKRFFALIDQPSQHGKSASEDTISIDLPNVLNGYQKWNSPIISDTLNLNVR